jgi:SGNH hydrolase-like domain, acetyltransferase AlgX
VNAIPMDIAPVRGTSRRPAAAAVAAVILSWAAPAVIARLDSRAAIAWSDPLVVVALVVSFAASSALYVRLAPGSKREAAFRVTVLTAVAAACLAIVEVPAVLGWVNYRRLWDRVTGNWRGPVSEYQLDYERAFRRVPNVHTVGQPQGDIAGRFNLPIRSPRPLEFTFNTHGFRGREDYTSADVVLIGDSYVEGWYVSDGETCAERLAARISHRVANLGQSGYGLEQELNVLQREALSLRPAWIVWFFYEGNDLYDDQEFENTMTYLAQAHGTRDEVARRMGYERTRFRDASFTLNAFSVLRRVLDPLVPNRSPYVGVFRDVERGTLDVYFDDEANGEFGPFERERLHKAELALAEGKRRCDQAGVRLLVAYIPTKFRVYRDYCEFERTSPCRSWRPWDLPQRFAELCARNGIDFLDLTGALKEEARAGHLLYVPQDTHWDRGAHELVSRLLAARYDRPLS